VARDSRRLGRRAWPNSGAGCHRRCRCGALCPPRVHRPRRRSSFHSGRPAPRRHCRKARRGRRSQAAPTTSARLPLPATLDASSRCGLTAAAGRATRPRSRLTTGWLSPPRRLEPPHRDNSYSRIAIVRRIGSVATPFIRKRKPQSRSVATHREQQSANRIVSQGSNSLAGWLAQDDHC
jgi:hypothetical protein